MKCTRSFDSLGTRVTPNYLLASGYTAGGLGPEPGEQGQRGTEEHQQAARHLYIHTHW